MWEVFGVGSEVSPTVAYSFIGPDVSDMDGVGRLFSITFLKPSHHSGVQVVVKMENLAGERMVFYATLSFNIIFLSLVFNNSKPVLLPY